MRRAALALALALAALAAPAAGAERAERLERLRAAIEESRARVERFDRDQRGLLDALEAVDRAAAELASEAARRARDAERAAAARREAEARLPALEARLAATRAALAGRVVALYKTGELGPAQLLFAATSLRELLERVRLLSVLLEHDRMLVERWRGELAALEAARAEAAETAAREARALEEVAERRRQLEAERATRERLLAAVASDRQREEAALAELEAAARALEETIARLGEAPEPLPDRPPGTPFASLRGRLPPPVDAPVVERFGRRVDAHFGTEILRRGVDFGAPRGAPVRAVAAGVVRFAGWFRGYGLMAIVDHGGGFHTVHGHLERLAVEVGDAVEAGAELGTVGDTGSLSGPRLYFEIREGGRAVDPAAWLARSRAAPRAGAAPAPSAGADSTAGGRPG